MTISVIIPAYNEEKYIGETLKSIISSAPENLLEIIVVNNASTDNTAGVAGQFSQVKLVNEYHKGVTRARQAGFLAARGDILAFIDADTHVSQEWFGVLNSQFAADSLLVGLSGPYEYYDLTESKRLLADFWYFCAKFLSLVHSSVVIIGNFAAKRRALLAVGGFDTRIEFYGDDTDIALKLKKLGKVKFLKDFQPSSSARRLNGQGLLVTAFYYAINYFSMIILKRPVTFKYIDIR